VTIAPRFVSSLRTRRIRAPLTLTWGEDVRDLQFIVVEIRDNHGDVGIGFSWTPTIGAASVQAMLDEDIAPAIVGGSTEPEELWEPLWLRLHEAGSGGIVTMAMAGVDLALWDLRGRRAGRTLTEELGSRRDRVPCYGSGVNFHFSLRELRFQAERWAEAGFRAVKLKVGHPDPGEDVARIRAVREILGVHCEILVDANQRWTLREAQTALDLLAPLGIGWIEEPLRADDLTGYRELARSTDVPIALGENVATHYRFREFLDAEACAIIQPNVVRVGGITPFLRIAALAAERQVRVAPHLLPEVSTQIALSLPQETWVESVDGAGLAELGVLSNDDPIVIEAGWARGRVGAAPGLGLDFAPA
jgi:L-alanine-DL-glutamate epimerase-like enolase superfamily enzyme